MKATILKIVTKRPTAKRVPVTIEDTLPPPINAVTVKPTSARSGRHLDVDAVLARSLPNVVSE